MSISAYASGTSAIAAPAGASPTVSMNTTDVLKSSAIGTTYANLQYNTTGEEFQNSGRNDNFSTSRGDWLDSGSSSDVWVERTINSGSLLTDPGSGRLQLSTTRSFKVRDTDGGSGFNECDMDMDMWDAASGGSNLDSVANLILRANYNNPCPLCCFMPDTMITMGDGSTKPICEIDESDSIRVYGGASEKVTEVIVRQDRSMWKIELEDGRILILSEDHPVFVQGKGYSCINPEAPYKDLTDTDTLIEGDTVKLESGVLLRVVKMTRDPFRGTVYTLGNSRFYANGILVY